MSNHEGERETNPVLTSARAWGLERGLFGRIEEHLSPAIKLVSRWTEHLPLDVVLDMQFLMGDNWVFFRWYRGYEATCFEFKDTTIWPYQKIVVPAVLMSDTNDYVYGSDGRLSRHPRTWPSHPVETLCYVFVTDQEDRALTTSDYFDGIEIALKNASNA